MKDYLKYKLPNVKGELLDFQYKIITSQNSLIIFNGCRNASKTFTLVKYIEYNKPKNVLYIAENECDYNNLMYNIKENTNLKIINNHNEKNIEYNKLIKLKANNEIINLYFNIDYNINYDCVLYDNALPCYNMHKNEIKSNQTIVTINKNNYSKWIEKFYPNAHLFQVDCYKLFNIGLLKEKTVEEAKQYCKQNNKLDIFYNEYAILGENEYELKINDIVEIKGNNFITTDKEFDKITIYKNSLEGQKFIINKIENNKEGCIDYKLKNEIKQLIWRKYDFKR